MSKEACKNSKCADIHQHIPVRQGSSSANEILVIGYGPHTFVWIGKDNVCIGHVGGEAAMRKLRDALDRALRRRKRTPHTSPEEKKDG